jgi:hypothetical protein
MEVGTFSFVVENNYVAGHRDAGVKRLRMCLVHGKAVLLYSYDRLYHRLRLGVFFDHEDVVRKLRGNVCDVLSATRLHISDDTNC